jgi:hypothetical protein
VSFSSGQKTMIKINQTKRHYNTNNNHIHKKRIVNDSIVVIMDVEILSENFAEFQKEIFQEHFAQLEEDITSIKNISENEIKAAFENVLQNLNSKLTVFGEKISKTEFFPIKGSIKIYSGDILLASLIGNTSILIFRD